MWRKEKKTIKNGIEEDDKVHRVKEVILMRGDKKREKV